MFACRCLLASCPAMDATLVAGSIAVMQQSRVEALTKRPRALNFRKRENVGSSRAQPGGRGGGAAGDPCSNSLQQSSSPQLKNWPGGQGPKSPKSDARCHEPNPGEGTQARKIPAVDFAAHRKPKHAHQTRARRPARCFASPTNFPPASSFSIRSSWFALNQLRLEGR